MPVGSVEPDSRSLLWYAVNSVLSQRHHCGSHHATVKSALRLFSSGAPREACSIERCVESDIRVQKGISHSWRVIS
jgi:hypothetical protein